MENKTITTYHKPFIVYIITALMISASIIYLVVSFQNYEQISIAHSSDSNAAADISAMTNEMTFFLIVGIAYIPIAIWMLKVKHNSKIPYTIAIIGSAALILFYALTRTINIPTIGLQPDIGIIDIAAKVVQVGIVTISSYLIITVVRRRKQLESSLVENQQNRKYRTDGSKFTKTDFSNKKQN